MSLELTGNDLVTSTLCNLKKSRRSHFLPKIHGHIPEAHCYVYESCPPAGHCVPDYRALSRIMSQPFPPTALPHLEAAMPPPRVPRAQLLSGSTKFNRGNRMGLQKGKEKVKT